MKPFVGLLLGAILWAGTTHATALTLNFSSAPGSTIQFNGTGSSFQFNSSPLSGPFFSSQWLIGSESGGMGSAVGLLGLFNNGPFHYGAITTVINGLHIDESATVTGPLAALVIQDGSGNLTGNVNWVQIATDDFGGSINAALTVNLTGLAYGGSNPDLVTLAANGLGALNLTFQFSPGMTLADLTTGSGPYQTSYSGSLSTSQSVPDETSAGILLLTSLAVLAGFQRVIIGRRLKAT